MNIDVRTQRGSERFLFTSWVGLCPFCPIQQIALFESFTNFMCYYVLFDIPLNVGDVDGRLWATYPYFANNPIVGMGFSKHLWAQLRVREYYDIPSSITSITIFLKGSMTDDFLWFDTDHQAGHANPPKKRTTIWQQNQFFTSGGSMTSCRPEELFHVDMWNQRAGSGNDNCASDLLSEMMRFCR